MKKVIFITLALVILVGGYWAYNDRQASAQNQVVSDNLETVVVEIGSLVDIIGATGRVRANQTALLTWHISGDVETVDIQVGDSVIDGQALASLEQSSLSPDIILAQVDLVDAQRAFDDLLNSSKQQAQALKTLEDAEIALEAALDPEMAQAEAVLEIAQAEKLVDDAQREYDILTAPTPQAAIDQAYATLLLAENKLNQTIDDIAKLELRSKTVGGDLPPAIRNDIRRGLKKALEGLQTKKIQDQQAYDDSLARYNNLLAPPEPIDLAAAEAELLTAQSRLDESQRQWERIKDGSSPGEIALLEAQLEDAQREWERVKDGPDPDDIAAAQSRVAAAEAILDQRSIHAPFDGVVTMVDNQPGDKVKNGTTAVRIDDLSRLMVDLQVSELDINQIAVGQSVEMTFDAIFSSMYHGEVVEVAMVGGEEQGVSSFKVSVVLIDPDENIRPGMTSAVNIVTTQIEEALIIPKRAVSSLEGASVVYILRASGELQLVEMSLGKSSDKYIQVINSDLQAGDVLLLNPSDVQTSRGDGS